jgi:hypothetical protein
MTLCLSGEGNIGHGVSASHGRTRRSLSILACVDTFCAIVANREIREKSDTEKLE